MGVIIDGNERKSIAEQVEENSKYNGRFVRGGIVLYKKDLPCFVRVMVATVDEDPAPEGLTICGGNGQVLYEMNDESKLKDLLVVESVSGVWDMKVYDMNGTNFSGKSATYGQDNKALIIHPSTVSYCIVIPLKK